MLTVRLGQVHSGDLKADNGKNKLVFDEMHLSNSHRWIILAANTCEYAFVVET